ncbi:MAG: YHS domain-containing protein, partial [Verrucomicrobia bacterium]|nr:YHS domain-containing protein [Verrucomicrobiota bacterium]
MKTDPICGMQVDETTALSAERDGATFYFCSNHCRQKFLGQPKPGSALALNPATSMKDSCGGKSGHAALEAHGHSHAHLQETPACCGDRHALTQAVKPSAAAKYFCPMCPGVESDAPGDCPKCGMALERNPAWKPAGKVSYACPMHPEIEQDHPGDCPKCGMALEPRTVGGADTVGDDSELRDMTRRFWIGAVLTLPVFLVAMVHVIPALAHQSWLDGDASRWMQFALSTPVVLWAGWPFFRRGWRSLVTAQFNMWTLIMIGVGAAFLFSTVAMLAPGVFPDSMRPHGQVGI